MRPAVLLEEGWVGGHAGRTAARGPYRVSS